MFAAKFPYPLIIALGEYGPPGLSHAGDDRDRGPGKSEPGQFLTRGVLQQAEQPELLTSGPGQADFVPAAHHAMHGLPLSSAGKSRGRGCGNRVQDCRELRVDAAGALIQELQCGRGLIDAR